MDQGSGAGHPSPAAISASVKSVITNQPTQTQVHPEAFIRRPTDHRVADLFGRFFLRVCYWVDVFSTIKRRGEPLAFVPFPRPQAASLPELEPEKPRIKTDAETTAPATPIASA